MNKNGLLLTCLAGFVLSACGGGFFDGNEEPPLPGDRLSVLELQKSLEPDDFVLEGQGLVMPVAWKNDYWPQAGGYPNHSMQNLVLPEGALKRVWSADIGDGSSDEIPLTAQPVLVDGRIFTLDTEGRLSAFSIDNGKQIWRRDVSDKDEGDSVIAGGIAFSDNALFVTNGYAELLSVGLDKGDILWRAKLPAPSRAAPTIINGRIFVTLLDNRLMAMNVVDGTVLWEYAGLSEGQGLVGAASPAANNDIVVPVFSSGEVAALRVENGSVAWADSLSNVRGAGGLSAIADIKAMPVIDKGLVIAVSFSGRLAAIDERTGTRVWQREISSVETPWVAGNHVFVLSSENQLVALGRDNGVVLWVTELPRFDDDDPIILTGPVFAGGRLIIAGTDGVVYEVAPETGKIVREWDAGDTVSIPPLVAGGTLYMLSEDGKLSAYR
jgi:outer membrane protein assembly factor BamB